MMDRVPKNPGFWVLKCFKKHVLFSVSFYTIFVLMQYLEIVQIFVHITVIYIYTFIMSKYNHSVIFA